jgi:SAM-dependent methyltransferase
MHARKYGDASVFIRKQKTFSLRSRFFMHPGMTELAPGIYARYTCEPPLLPVELGKRFVALDYDQGAQDFVAQVTGARTSRLRTALFLFLRKLMSDYDAYALLGMYSMHVLSSAQWKTLLGDWLCDFTSSGKALRLIDVGAGEGGVTACAKPFFADITVTEASKNLRKHLRKRGYRVVEHDLGQTPWPVQGERFDVVSAFNVIDRTARPRTLLSHMRALLADEGRLLVSVPLPLRPHVHVGPTTVDQDEPLPSAEGPFEHGVAALCRDLFAPLGLRVLAFSRVPYLCQGDANAALYVLDDAVFVCERA